METRIIITKWKKQEILIRKHVLDIDVRKEVVKYPWRAVKLEKKNIISYNLYLILYYLANFTNIWPTSIKNIIILPIGQAFNIWIYGFSYCCLYYNVHVITNVKIINTIKHYLLCSLTGYILYIIFSII